MSFHFRHRSVIFFARFGLLNVKYGVATAVKNFNLTFDKRTCYPVKLNAKNPSMDIDGGYWMKFDKI
jgi:hypothetical protein